MSVLYGACGSIENSFDRTYSLSSREPVLWNERTVTQEDSNGNPLYVEYYYDGVLVFSQQSTYNSQSKETSIKIYKP